MDILDEDILSLWRCLNKNNVQYIMIGGFASMLYGTSRITQDVDVWIKDTLENRQQLRASLKELELGDFAELEHIEIVSGYTTIYLKAGVELDLFTNLKAFTQKDFDECYTLSLRANIENMQVPFLHINHLLQEKQTNSRPKDLQDIEELKAIIKLQANK